MTVAGRDGARYGALVVDVPYGRLRGLLLDLGNTLIGMDAALVARALSDEGVACTPERFRRAEAASRPALSAWIAEAPPGTPAGLVYVREILARLEVPPVDRVAVAPRVLARMRSVPTERLWSEVLPGVPDALERLRDSGLRLVIVSNSDGTAEAGLVAAGLRGHVDAVVDSFFFGAEKPDRRIFEHALGLADLTTSSVAHVGDLFAADVLGARAAGLHAVLLDPFGDWPDMGCATAPDLPSIAARVAAPA